MSSLTQIRAPMVTLAAYLTLVGSLAFAMSASAGQSAADDHSRHNCVAQHAPGEIVGDDAATLNANPTGPADAVEVPAASQPAQQTGKPSKRSRRKNQVESALFHFSF